jgi:hypothetical protein
MTQQTSLLRKSAAIAAALGMALLLSGCVIVPAPYYHPPRYGYYGWR